MSDFLECKICGEKMIPAGKMFCKACGSERVTHPSTPYLGIGLGDIVKISCIDGENLAGFVVALSYDFVEISHSTKIISKERGKTRKPFAEIKNQGITLLQRR